MLEDKNKSQEQLIDELAALRRQMAQQRAAAGELDVSKRPQVHLEVQQRLRDAIAQMQRSDEIQKVLSVLEEGLRELEIPFHDCGINLVDSRYTPTVRITSLGDGEKGKELRETWAQDLIFQFWQAGVPVYRRDLQAEDVYGEHKGQLEHFGYPVRCMLDIPFAYGTLAVNSKEPSAFSSEDITDLKQLTVVLEEGFRRREDLRTLEQRNRELEREIGERKQAEEALRKKQQERENLINAIDGIVWEVDVERFEFTFVSQKAERLLGYPTEQWLHNSTFWVSHMHESDREWTTEFCMTAVREGRDHEFEYRMIAADGRIVWLRDIVKVVTEKGRLTKLQGVMIDITEHKQMEEEIRKNQNLESLGILAGGIAHDFNNLLTGVMGNLSLLEMMLNKDSDEYQIAKEGQRAAERTRDLTQQLLTFAKGGAPVKKRAAIDVLVREMTELSLHGSKTKAEYQLAENLHSVFIDPGQIGQVLQNLVINADQAMPEGGTLVVAAENVVISERDPLPLAAGDYVKVSVVDQGIGMSSEVMAKIFDPYYTTKLAGHGLGLSITHSIVQRHDGHIEVRSEQNVGTTFEFYLPAEQRQTAGDAKPRETLARGTGRILLMDDEQMIHATVAKMLERLGYEVQGVYDGAAAIEAYKAAIDEGLPYDLVIMDLTIPGGMGGQEAIGKLLAIDPQARVLVSSGYAHDPVMAHYAEYGFAGAMAKPVTIRQLAQTIKGVLKA